jgi:hypothetical protein
MKYDRKALNKVPSNCLKNKITKGSPLVFINHSSKNVTEEDNKYNNLIITIIIII